MKPDTKAIQKRLMPLFVSDFFAGLMFWYPVIFSFMHHEGLTTSQLTLYTVFANILLLLIEIPFSVLADRWSRKKVLILGTCSTLIGLIIFGQARNFTTFIVGGMFTVTYFALRSGMHEAMIYDVLFEHDNRKVYEQQLSKLRIYNTAGNVLSSLLGAVLAATLGFPSAFYVSCVSCVFAIVFYCVLMNRNFIKQLKNQAFTAHYRLV